MQSEHWSTVRDLFDRHCELPREQWRPALEACCSDPAIIGEVLRLLMAQTPELASLDALVQGVASGGPMAGQMLGPWRLVEKIGVGGMGVVFKAERADGAYRQAVAIKLLHRLAGEHENKRLASERQILANLELPGMARLYDGGVTADGHPYLVMELVEGASLETWCRERAPALQQRLDLFLQVCAVVQAAHEKTILHCDLKPDNILVRADGSPVLLDFGLAQAMGDIGDGQGRYYTPAYASPARRRGEPASVADDVFSLGVMLVEMLACTRCERPTAMRANWWTYSGRSDAGPAITLVLPAALTNAARMMYPSLAMTISRRPPRASTRALRG